MTVSIKSRISALVCATGMMLCASTSQATYSVCAVDRSTGLVGCAATTCAIGSGEELVNRIFFSVPGKGVIVSQASTLRFPGYQTVVPGLGFWAPLNDEFLYPDDAYYSDYPIEVTLRQKFESGERAEQIANFLKNHKNSYWRLYLPQKQFAVLDLDPELNGNWGAHTGDNSSTDATTNQFIFNGGWTGEVSSFEADSLKFDSGPYTVAIQGNTLTGLDVLANAETAFRNGGFSNNPDTESDLAERLMNALEGGANMFSSGPVTGDKRCVDRFGVPGYLAFIAIDHTTQEFVKIETDPETQAEKRYLFIDEDLEMTEKLDANGEPILNGDGSAQLAPTNPLPRLREKLNAWRAFNPRLTPRHACVADCNRNGEVTLTEVTLAYQIRSNGTGLASCSSADPDQDGTVSDAELDLATTSNTRGCN